MTNWLGLCLLSNKNESNDKVVSPQLGFGKTTIKENAFDTNRTMTMTVMTMAAPTAAVMATTSVAVAAATVAVAAV